MSDLKKESRFHNDCPENSCCNSVNDAISAYFRDATTALGQAISAIILAFPFPLVTSAQLAAIGTNCPTIATIVAGVALTADQAIAVNSLLVAFGITTAFVAGSILTAAQVASLNAICATFGGATVGTPIAPGTALATSFAALLDAFLAPGAGATFIASLATVAAERTARIVALKTKFDDIDLNVLSALQALLSHDADKKCCASAAESIRSTAINFLRLAISTAVNPGIPVLPVPGPGVIPTPGSLQFLLENYDRELAAATRVILSTVICFREEEEFEEEKCLPCNDKVHVKPGRKVFRHKEEKCKEEEHKKDCNKKDHRRHEVPHRKEESCSWKYEESNLKW